MSPSLLKAKEFVPLPAPGDILYCFFSTKERGGIPGRKPRPVLVLGTMEFDDGTPGLRVAYGTSKKVQDLISGEFAIRKLDGPAYTLSGLSFETKFNLKNSQDLPYNEEWFRVPPNPRHGQTPKLGTLHPSLMHRAKAAFEAISFRPK